MHSDSTPLSIAESMVRFAARYRCQSGAGLVVLRRLLPPACNTGVGGAFLTILSSFGISAVLGDCYA
jgi:hypothetical protein